MILHRLVTALAVLALAGCAAVRTPITADLVVTNGRIATLDAGSHVVQAMAVRDGRILAVGSNADMQALAGSGTRVVDAGGRTVIPGLIDSHMHAVRAALSYSTEVNWIGATTIAEAMQRLRDGARARPGRWVIVAGGWTELQFAEKRKPTLAEVLAAVPDQPVWIQMFYSHLLLTPKAQETLAVSPTALPAGMAVERDAAGNATGWVTANIVNMSALFDKLPRPTFEDNVTGTRQFFGELNRLALTGVVDPGGFSIYPSQYAALMKLWQDKQLSLRVAYSLFAQKGGQELAEYQELTQMLPMGFGDDMLRFNGIGERITIAMYNNSTPDAAAREKFLEVLRWAARQRMALTIHCNDDRSAQPVLDAFEQVNREVPLAPLRWSIAHLDNATPQTFARMKALGVAWTVQDAMYLSGDRLAAQAGEAARLMPPLMTAVRLGVHVGAGTDAHRVASYNPFVALQWMLDGRTVGGRATRGPDETPTREQALRLYTQNSAWFSFDEARRGTLEPGKLADFAILDRDFFSVPVGEVGRTVSLFTVVGGKPVYAASPFGTQP